MKKWSAFLLSVVLAVSPCSTIYASEIADINDVSMEEEIQESRTAETQNEESGGTVENTNAKADEVPENDAEEIIESEPEEDVMDIEIPDAEEVETEENTEETVGTSDSESGRWKGLLWIYSNGVLTISPDTNNPVHDYQTETTTFPQYVNNTLLDGMTHESEDDYYYAVELEQSDYDGSSEIYLDVEYDEYIKSEYEKIWEDCPWARKNTNFTDNITEIVIKDGVKEVGGFKSYPNLQSVTIGKDVEKIGYDAFSCCSFLKNVTFDNNNSLKVIDGHAFSYCSRLESINLPDTVEYINCYAFDTCELLNFEALPENIIEIGHGAFNFNTNLTLKQLPSNLRYLGDGAFYYCSSLNITQIPKYLKILPENAFLGCESIKTINLANVTDVNARAFLGCTSLTSVTMQANCTDLGAHAFTNCTSLKTITCKKFYALPDSYVFKNDGNLAKINFSVSGRNLHDIFLTDEQFKIFKDTKIRVVYSPTGLKIQNTLNGVYLQWTKSKPPTNLSNISYSNVKYKIYRTVDGKKTLIATVAGTSTSYLDKTATAGKYCKYTITATYNGLNESRKPKSIGTVRLKTPTITSVSSANSKMTVKWNKMSGVRGYRIFYSTDSSFSKNVNKVIVTGQNTVQKTISGLKKGKKYYIRVQTYQKVGTSYYYSGYSYKKAVTIK